MGCPSKWTHGPQPAVSWWFNFGPYPSGALAPLLALLGTPREVMRMETEPVLTARKLQETSVSVL